MKALIAHSINKSNLYRALVDYKLNSTDLEIFFYVSSPQYTTSESFQSDFRKNWGLWEFDVVEAFIQLRENEKDISAPYLEMQVSPLGQGFALKIVKPRAIFYTPLDLHYEFQSEFKNGDWQARMRIPLSEIGVGKLVYGNFFGCFGKDDAREYCALHINPEAKPDYHRPELFLKL